MVSMNKKNNDSKQTNRRRNITTRRRQSQQGEDKRHDAYNGSIGQHGFRKASKHTHKISTG